MCFLCVRIQFEDAAKEVADEVTRPRPEGEEELHDIQIMLKSSANPQTLRNMKVRPRSGHTSVREVILMS